jgi:hypothetical protein
MQEILLFQRLHEAKILYSMSTFIRIIMASLRHVISLICVLEFGTVRLQLQNADLQTAIYSFIYCLVVYTKKDPKVSGLLFRHLIGKWSTALECRFTLEAKRRGIKFGS